MPKLHIHAINSEFSARDDGVEYPRPEDALATAVRSAAAMALDDVYDGKTNVAIEVRIEQADGTPLLRSVVTLSVAALLPGA